MNGPLLESALGHRVRFLATVDRFSAKKNWQGLQQPTIVLTNIRFEANGVKVLDSQTLNQGVWSQDLYPGHRISFEGRFDTVEKRDGSTCDLILRPSRTQIL
jgi:hypothetical protein